MKRVVFSCLLIFSSTSFSQTIVTEDSTIVLSQCDAQFIGGYEELNTYLPEFDYYLIKNQLFKFPPLREDKGG